MITVYGFDFFFQPLKFDGIAHWLSISFYGYLSLTLLKNDKGMARKKHFSTILLSAVWSRNSHAMASSFARFICQLLLLLLLGRFNEGEELRG